LKREFTHAAQQEGGIYNRQTSSDNAKIREGYYLDLMRPLIVEYLKAYNVVGEQERLRASETRHSALKKVLNDFDPSYAPDHGLPPVPVSMSS